MPFRRVALILSVVAGLHGLLYVPLVSKNEGTDTWTYVATANAILDGAYSTPLQAGDTTRVQRPDYVRRNTAEVADRWKRELSAGEVGRVRGWVEPVAARFYAPAEW